MLYLLSVTLVVCTIVCCALCNVYLRLLNVERDAKEIARLSNDRIREVERSLTSQIEFVNDTAKKAQLTTSSYTSRVEELNNKIAGLTLKK